MCGGVWCGKGNSSLGNKIACGGIDDDDVGDSVDGIVVIINQVRDKGLGGWGEGDEEG